MSITDRIPCRYIVARYVEDDVRDEPINLGVILQSQRDYEVTFKFITDYSYKALATSVNVNRSLLTQILKNIENEISKSESQESILNELISKHSGKIRFTEPRGTLAEDLEEEMYSLFDRYVSIKHYRELSKLPISHYNIRKSVSGFLRKIGKRVVTGHKIQGATTVNRFDLLLEDTRMIFQAISFQELRAVDRAKLFDWSVNDCIAKYHNMHKDDFGTIISEPKPTNERYDKLKQHFDEGIKILSESGYQIVKFDKHDDRWQNDILVAARK